MIYNAENMNQKVIWPQIFDSRSIEGIEDALLCADGLTAWANCMSGAEPHKNFGYVMALIADKLDVLGTPESLSSWGDKYIQKRQNRP